MALRTVPKPVNPVESQMVQPPVTTPITPMPGTPTDTTVTGIERLAELRREGLLTEAEYASAKARLFAEQPR
jgi:hypothetical protein